MRVVHAHRLACDTRFPPLKGAAQKRTPPGIPEKIRAARRAKRLTWFAVAKLAGVPSSNTVRDIEDGRDAEFSSVIAVARVLGLRLELVEEHA